MKAKMKSKIEVQLEDSRTFYTTLGIMKKVEILNSNGILTFYTEFEFDCSGQGAVICIDDYDETRKRRIGTKYGTDLIIKVMKMFNVENFHDLAGRHAYALYDEYSFNSYIRGIMHPITNEYILFNDVDEDGLFK